MMSTLLSRYLEKHIQEDLTQKMVFLGGPRQVGKTTFAQSLIPHFEEGSPCYLNWDNIHDRKKILAGELPPSDEGNLIIFDEIHKYKHWRNLIKGFFDRFKMSLQFLVTGSARLDLYRKGGDSLLGRYFYYRLHPLSWPELRSQEHPFSLAHLLEYGGFPEPFLKASPKDLRRWHIQRTSRIVNTDIRDLENIRDISLLELLISALPARVGSPLSKKNLAQDLGVDFKTIERWITILENTYYCYRISPFGAPKIKAVKKEQKLFLWDWSELEDPGARFENFVGSHLLKYCHFLEDTEGFRMKLRFLRDTTGKEIDFVVLQNKKPLFAVECKHGDKGVSPWVKYFSTRTLVPMFYQVHMGTNEFKHSENVWVLPFERFCTVVRLV